MKLLIKNKDNKDSEYCFNKNFFIAVLSMLAEHVSTQSAVVNTGEKTKLKKPNEKTKSGKT